MAEANRQTGEQITALTTQFASLSKMQAMNRPPTMRVFCYTLPDRKPATEYDLRIESIKAGAGRGELFANTYTTNHEGWIDTGPLQQTVYELSGALRSPKVKEPTIAAEGEWRQVGLTDLRRCVRQEPPMSPFCPETKTVPGAKATGTTSTLFGAGPGDAQRLQAGHPPG